jgi:hypothetical protein
LPLSPLPPGRASIEADRRQLAVARAQGAHPLGLGGGQVGLLGRVAVDAVELDQVVRGPDDELPRPVDDAPLLLLVDGEHPVAAGRPGAGEILDQGDAVDPVMAPVAPIRASSVGATSRIPTGSSASVGATPGTRKASGMRVSAP